MGNPELLQPHNEHLLEAREAAEKRSQELVEL
jgi:hypothetical protein